MTAWIKPASALATRAQSDIEERAIGIFASDRLQAALALTLTHFQADRNAGLPDQAALIRQSVGEHYFHAVLMAASETPRNPTFVWTIAHDHRWMGLHVPGSRFGQDNSDNCYRLACIDPALSYRLAGRFVARRPCDFSICALAGQPGENILADTTALIAVDGIDIDAGGRFSIVVDSSATAGRRNHLCIAGARMLFARDTLADWAFERPCELAVECREGTRADAFDKDAATDRAAQLGDTIARHMLEVLQHGMFERGPVNTLNPPWSAGANGGLATQASALGHYRLAEDEGMIITADRLGARYLGMQITDIWMLSYEYRRRTSSLNHAQAVADGYGRYRWVISRRDPGVHNWLDSGGNGCGTILLRWQHLPTGVVPTAADVTTELVGLDALAGCLPRDTLYLNEAARAAQRARRLVDYENRIA